MNKRNKIILLIIVTSLIIGVLSGCTLAREEGSVKSSRSNNQDLLKGAYVVIGFHTSEGGKYEGVVNEDGTISFKELEGYYFGLKTNTLSSGDNTVATANDNTLQECSIDIFSNGNSTTYKITANIFCNYNFKNVLCLYNVFQRPDQSYYCEKTTSNAMIDEVGVSGSISVKSSNKSVNNDKEKEESFEFILNFAKSDETITTRIKEMNAKDERIKTTTLPQTYGNEFITDKDTSYVIVEEVVKQDSDSPSKRSIYTLNDRSEDEILSHTLFYPAKNNILIPKIIQFKHP